MEKGNNWKKERSNLDGSCREPRQEITQNLKTEETLTKSNFHMLKKDKNK